MISTFNSICLFVFLVLFHSWNLVLADQCNKKISWLNDNVNALESVGETVADVINKNKTNIETVNEIIEYMNRLGNIHDNGGPGKGWKYPCEDSDELRNRAKSLPTFMEQRGLGSLYKCLGIIPEEDDKFSKKLFTNTEKFSDFLKYLKDKILRDYSLQWESITTLEMIKHNATDSIRKCDLSKLLSYRKDGSWSVNVLFTNEPVNRYMRDGRETFLAAIEMDQNANLLRTLEVSTPNCSIKNARVNGTALLDTFQGRPSTSHFYFLSLENNPAIIAALQKGQHQKELVEDFNTRSNDALVFLPALLALVPIGLFQDISLSFMVLYIVATDIISVLPLLIKGWELIDYGSDSNYATVSHFYGGSTEYDLAVAETWCAKCFMKPGIKRKGIWLVCAAVAFIVLGIVFELVTRFFLDIYKKELVSSIDEDVFVDTKPENDRPRPYEEGSGLLYHISRSRLQRISSVRRN